MSGFNANNEISSLVGGYMKRIQIELNIYIPKDIISLTQSYSDVFFRQQKFKFNVHSSMQYKTCLIKRNYKDKLYVFGSPRYSGFLSLLHIIEA